MEMSAGPGRRAEVASRLARHAVGSDDQVIVMPVSAGNPFRRWPVAHFVDLAARSPSRPRRRIVVTSGPSEQDASGRVIADAQARLGAARASQVLSCGEFSLAELRALLDRACLYIGGEQRPAACGRGDDGADRRLTGRRCPVRSAPWPR
jgi:ADP-heptose:LPS heptosyltransferase